MSVASIISVVCEHYKVPRDSMLSDTRAPAVVKPRQIAIYLSRIITMRSAPHIGRMIGGKDHTTVLYAARKIGDLVAKNMVFAAEIENLRLKILGESNAKRG